MGAKSAFSLDYFEYLFLMTWVIGKTPPKKEEDICSWTNMKPVIHNLKAKCCIQQKSVKACKREIKSLTNALSSDPASKATAVFLKSNFEYMVGRIKVLSE